MLIAASTAAAPLMSAFIIAWLGLLGFKLMPPESYITPLPTMIRCGADDFLVLPPAFVFAPALPGRYTNFTMRGGFTLPRFTPMMPPQPMASNLSLSYTSTRSPDSDAICCARSANILAVKCAGGMLAKSRAMHTASPTTAPRREPLAAAPSDLASTTSTTDFNFDPNDLSDLSAP